MKWIKWLYPGLNLKRWLFLFGLGTVLSCVGVTLIFNYQFVGLIEALVFNFISYHKQNKSIRQPLNHF